MRSRWLVSAVLVVASAASGVAGDGDKAKAAADTKVAKPVTSIALVRPAPKDLAEALRRLASIRVTVTFKDTSFTEAVEYVRRVAGINVMVSPVLQNKGVDGIRPMTMSLNDVSLRQLAELVAQASSTKLKFEDGILQFTTPEDARGKPVLRIIAIGDLTMKLHNFPGPDLNLRPAKAELPDDPESDVENAWSDPQKVIDLVQKMCSPDTWTDKDVSISADQNKLIVRQYPEVQREIGRLIGLLRGAR